jgi:hypothetical protein
MQFQAAFQPNTMSYNQYEQYNPPSTIATTTSTDEQSAMPSFRTAYPESSEREECCLGLISCDPCVLDEMGNSM